ncbi:MAG: hypothetical protein AAF657_39490, partial [Acidobacteriota bacterium]
ARDLAALQQEHPDVGKVLKPMAIGESALSDGDLAAALRRFEQAASTSRELGIASTEAKAHVRCAGVHIERADLAAAAEHLARAQALEAELDNSLLQTDILFHQGQVAYYRGELAEASRLHRQASRLREGIWRESRVAQTKVAFAANRLSEAWDSANEALPTYGFNEPSLVDVLATSIFIELFVLANPADWEASRRTFLGDLDDLRQVPHARARFEVEILRARLAARKRMPDAVEQLSELAARARQGGWRVVEMEARRAGVQLARKAGLKDKAEEARQALNQDADASGLKVFHLPPGR